MSRRSSIVIVLIALIAAGTPLAGCGGRSSEPEALTAQERTARNQAQKILSRARSELSEDRYDRALSLIEKAEELDSTYAWIPYLRGEVYRAMNRSERARTAYERALELDEGHPEVRLRLGDLARESENHEQALEWYDRQWQLLQEQLESRGWTYDGLPRGSRIATLMRTVPVRQGRTLAEMGRTDEAVERIRSAIDRDANHAAAHYYLAQILREEGRTEAALARAQKAVDLQPEAPQYRYLLGGLLLDEDRPKEAIPHLRRVLEQRPSHVGAHYNLGQALVRTGKREEGKRYMARSDSLRSLQQKIDQARVTARGQQDNPARWLELAHLLRRAGRLSESVNAYRTALAIDSTITDAWFGLGIAYGRGGRRKAARQAFNRVLEIDPDHEQARAFLQKLNAAS